MNSPGQTLCPIPDMGYCIYEKCPYWDHNRQECDADCLQDQESSQIEPTAGPCTIHWTEDYD
jgi:hypothetical protein